MKKITSIPSAVANLLDFKLSKSEIAFDDIHILKAAQWLLRSQDVFLDQGYAHSFHLAYGWQSLYPETTGYIIPTILEVYKKYAIQELYDSAKSATAWLKSIQNADGSFMDLHGNKQVFDTGQILIGFNYLCEWFPEFDVSCNIKSSADWLCSVQNANGSFDKFSYNNIPHSYYSRVGAALIKAGLLNGDERYIESGRRNIQWTQAQQLDNGFFKYASFDDAPAYLHTMVYILEGLLDSYKLLGDSGILDSVIKCSDVLLDIAQNRDLILFSQYGEDFEPANREKCITGIAQWAGLCFDIFEITKDTRYKNEALKNVYYLKSKQIFSKNNNLDGGLPGSLPIGGKYLRYSIPNWGVKFFVDALLKNGKVDCRVQLVDEEKAYISSAFNCQKIFSADVKFTQTQAVYVEHIKNITDMFCKRPLKILDVGAGGGELVKLLQETYPDTSVLGVDPVYTSGAVSGGDVYDIPFEQGTFDVVICKEVLQHSGNLTKALCEIKRVLNESGVLIIIDRNPISFLGMRKKLYENLGKWMYPKDSPFKEKWYFGCEWRNILKYFGSIVYFKIQNNKHGRRLFFNRDNRFFVIGVKA